MAGDSQRQVDNNKGGEDKCLNKADKKFHEIKGQGIYAYVIASSIHGDQELARKDIALTVSRIIGPIAKPDKIQFVNGLPKTRSGKIMRRILRKIAEGETENLGDTTTLLDPAVVEEIRKGKLIN